MPKHNFVVPSGFFTGTLLLWVYYTLFVVIDYEVIGPDIKLLDYD